MKSKVNSYSDKENCAFDPSKGTISRISRSDRRKDRIKAVRRARARRFLVCILSVALLFLIFSMDILPDLGKELDIQDYNKTGGIDMEKHDWQLILVNSDNPLPEDYAPRLKEVQNRHMVDERIADFVTAMLQDARKDGITLLICSSYRSVSRQQELFDDEVKKYVSAGKSMDEALSAAAYGVAVPGYSEHNTGLALDIVTPEYQVLDSGFEATDAFKWLCENAHKYGFILRYPKDKTHITKIKYEPWHYRFVGTEHAERIYNEGICLEEYICD